MKKLLSIIGVFGLTITAATSVVACGGGSSETFEIVFVPSNSTTTLLKTVKPLEEKLETQLKEKAKERNTTFNKKVKVSVSTSYEAAGQSLKAGKADIGFVPVATYNSYKGELINSGNYAGTYSNLGILSQASRAGIITEFDKDITKPNSKVDAKVSLDVAKEYNKNILNKIENTKSISDIKDMYLSKEEDQTVAYYRSYIYINNSYLLEEIEKNNWSNGFENWTDAEYKNNIKKMIEDNGNAFAFGSSKTSSAGTLNPLLWLKNVLGYENSELKEIYESTLTKQGSYPEAAKAVANGTVKFAVGFSDIRGELPDFAESKDLFKKTTVIGLGEQIINDGIVYSRKRIQDSDFLSDVRESFVDLVKDPENKKIFDVYNHSGYVVPKDSENAISWEASQDQNIQDTTTAAEEMKALIKDWK
ncbi:phosphonate transport system substrate-binding protein [Williamsoniiplasma somnilux]|uniref:Phosphonate transport system substrate-binding protein n=1 Tax=Williamsoniiplasma somnilux TaxID=215578 RepID=A0A2K8NXX8_9MOLU|nr:PhnD/SsuA/transferrin family substrate-binding protein [Williamsoniiplasma somnilux]ATZ18406.1 phosphonate transport system substrate-binding protein [Williamsoniiplasma somnilux]